MWKLVTLWMVLFLLINDVYSFPRCGTSIDLCCKGKRVNSNEWMKRMRKHIGDVKLSQIKIPASHDSGTYAIDDFKDYSVDIPYDPVMALIPTLVNIFAAYRLNTTNIKSFVAPWVRTQKCSIADQLSHGLRHFDLRVCYGPDLVFRLCHALNANTVSQELAAIKEWSDQHPGEIISLDFNHLYGFDYNAHQAFANMTLAILGEDNIAANLTFNNTYNDFRNNGKRFKLFYASKTYAPLLLAEPSSNIITPWPNKQNLEELKLSSIANLNARSDFTKGFVSQVELTPSLYMMINGIVTNLHSVQDLSEQYYDVIASWVRNDFNHTKVNIVNTDYYYERFVKEVIKLNCHV